jgi:hypothetical protein
MIRATSIRAYNEIRDSGLLNRSRWRVYDVLFHHGPLTGGEIGSYMPGFRQATSTADRNIHARLTEMRDRDCIYEAGEKKCDITGKYVILWDVNGKLPREPAKEEIQPTRPELIRALCDLVDEILPAVKPTSDKGRDWVRRANLTLSKCKKFREKR